MLSRETLVFIFLSLVVLQEKHTNEEIHQEERANQDEQNEEETVLH